MKSVQIRDSDVGLGHDTAPLRGGIVSVQAAGLLAEAGIDDDFTLTRLNGGANNQVFRVDSSRGPVVLKAYFQDDGDHHDRLGAEYSFLSFAWQHDVRCVPRPLACDRRQGLAVYELVPGRRLAPEKVDAAAVGQAVAFYQSLNVHKDSAAAAALPHAAEACYTIGEHLACVERRLERLLRVEPTAGVTREAMSFVRSELRAAWVRVSRAARHAAVRHGLPLDASVPAGDRCLSPSDFGFHNAREDEAAKLRFIDFEYAGWDDPAKMVCDFFCQPTVPAPRECFDHFAETIATSLSRPAIHEQRFRLLLPVYQIKWCCILLNDFLPAGDRRRQFALPASQQEERRSQQLSKARAALRNAA